MSKKEYIFSSSKMSGLSGYNRKGFYKKKAELEKRGLRVWDQFQHQNTCSCLWDEEMARDLEMLIAHCWGIYMWGQWVRSQGAWIELITAQKMGLSIHIEQWYLRWIKHFLNFLFKN